MGKIELDHTGSGSGITLSSDGTDLLLDGTAIGGGGGSALELYAENPSSPTAPSATGTNAVAIGSNTEATGDRSMALIDGANAGGLRGFAVGFSATTTGNNSVAIGTSSVSSGTQSIAIGALTDATSDQSLALGYTAQAVTGAYATAISRSYASGADSFAAAIASNSSSYGATGQYGIAIGRQSKASGQNSTAIGTFRAYATGGQSIALGYFSSASSTYAISIGGTVTADVSKAVALGYEAKSSIKGKFAYSAEAFSAAGDAQTGIFVLRSDTTDATAEAMTTDNSAGSTDDQIILPNNSAYSFSGTIVARESATDGTDCAAWEVKGLIRREGSASTATLVNSATTVIDNTPSWGMALSADTTNGGLKIQVTGAASTNIRWVATIHTSEVTYA